MPRKIIHLDLDAFFCAVEERRKAELRGKPFAVGGRPEERGVVSSCSYAARQKGVRSAMPMSRALHLCPGLLVVPPDYAAYAEASRQVMERLHQVTRLVEQISIDEAFLDVSDLPEEAEQVALRLQEQIRSELSLPCSLGVASNKLAAKIATDVGKAKHRSAGPPNAITCVEAGREAEFLAELPAIALWGIGPKTAARLETLGIRTIGDLAQIPVDDLARRFGKSGYDLAQRARGIDEGPVETSHEAKSISREVTFAKDTRDPNVLFSTLRELSDEVGQSLRQESLAGVTVKLKLRWHNFTTLTRQETLSQPTDQGEVIYAAASELLNRAWQPKDPVRLIGVGVSGFGKTVRQLSLWEASSEKQIRLQRAVDELRGKFGDQILKRGRRI